MSKDEVISLMESSKSEAQWNAHCREVKAAFDGHYPPFWYETIIQSGLADRVLKAAGSRHGAKVYVSYE